MKYRNQAPTDSYLCFIGDGNYPFWILGIRWTNTESNRNRIQSIYSDIWEFGDDKIELEKHWMRRITRDEFPDLEYDEMYMECEPTHPDRLPATKVICND